MILFLLTNTLIFLSYLSLSTHLKFQKIYEKLLFAIVLSCAQIVFLEIFLGSIGALYVSALVIGHAIISLSILTALKKNLKSIFENLRNDIQTLKNGLLTSSVSKT